MRGFLVWFRGKGLGVFSIEIGWSLRVGRVCLRLLEGGVEFGLGFCRIVGGFDR